MRLRRSVLTSPRHPTAGYEQGLTIAAAGRRAAKESDPAVAQSIREKATRQLIDRVGEGSPAARHPRGEPAAKAA